MSNNAVQILANRIVLDRPYVPRSHWAYTVTVAERRGKDPSTQIYFSPVSYRVQKDGKTWTKDVATSYEGSGLLLCSTRLDGLDTINLSTYLIHDRAFLRDRVRFLQQRFKARGLDDSVATLLADVVNGALTSTAAGAIALLPGLVAFVTDAIRTLPDRPLIHAVGSLSRDDLLRHAEGTLYWGKKDQNDRGYFELDVDFMSLENPDLPVQPSSIPAELRSRLGPLSPQNPGNGPG